ncbi:MAG: RIP metalloprotease RseP [Deltaproteobacteria bacterium]|nr:RIP metalloprotease RseP [Deltaproteobacteria bacterium]
MSLISFIVLVGVLVFVHELGHFVWAKFFGVKVLRFSLGFGPRIISFKRGETEYIVAAIPLGGYVRMLGESPLDEIEPQDSGRALHTQNIFKRIVIVVSGPLMNLIFPIALYFVVFLGDTDLTPATVGMIFPDRPADGELSEGDRIVEIDGKSITTFYELQRTIEKNADVPLSFKIERDGQMLERTITPERSSTRLPLDRIKEIGRIGVMPHYPTAVIGVVSASSPAGSAGLRTFDKVVAAGGQPIYLWIDLKQLLEKNQGSLVPITYLRPNPIPNALGGLVELDVYEPRVTTLTPNPGKGSGTSRAGIEPADLYISKVLADSPEHRMGLLPGDRLLFLDGKPIRLWVTFLEDLKKGSGMSHTLRWRRGDRIFEERFSLENKRGVTEQGQSYDRYHVAITNWMPTQLAASIKNPRPIYYALREAVRATAEVVELTLFSVVRLLQGRLSVKTIGGPLMIFEYAGTAAREGALNYLTLMAFISINLGLLNLLPIPLLDGGHLLFFFVEAMVQRPISIRVREYAYIAGLAFLLIITILAFKNDIERKWPEIVDGITTK